MHKGLIKVTRQTGWHLNFSHIRDDKTIGKKRDDKTKYVMPVRVMHIFTHTDHFFQFWDMQHDKSCPTKSNRTIQLNSLSSFHLTYLNIYKYGGISIFNICKLCHKYSYLYLSMLLKTAFHEMLTNKIYMLENCLAWIHENKKGERIYNIVDSPTKETNKKKKSK